MSPIDILREIVKAAEKAKQGDRCYFQCHQWVKDGDCEHQAVNADIFIAKLDKAIEKMGKCCPCEEYNKDCPCEICH